MYNPESREVITRKDVKVTEPEIKAQASLPEDAEDESEEEEAEKPKVEKKGPGRPKGSKNKARGTPEKLQMQTRSKGPAGSPRTPKRDYREQPMDSEEAFGESPEIYHPLSDDSFGSAADGELEDEDAELSNLFGSAMLTHHSDNLPSCYQEAMKSPESHKWNADMSEKMEPLRQSHTWELVPMPKVRKLIANRWVFTTKRDRAGNVLRQKARLVAKKFTQRKGIDFQETFAPVIRFESLRMLLAVAAHKRMAMTQFDVMTAFLNGTIE